MKKIAFICVHNSCRSQIAEALGKYYCNELFESYSAGTETKPNINQDAVRLMKEMYNIDMEKEQWSKLYCDIPSPDAAISMGCNVGCPYIGRGFDENWGIEDPTGKSDKEFKKVINEIEKNIFELRKKYGAYVKEVEEADFGCEGVSDNEIIYDKVMFSIDDKDAIVEIPRDRLWELKIDEGDWVSKELIEEFL